MESLVLGVGGCLVFGLGFCFAMGVIGNTMWLGILLGLIGAVGMIFTYPINRKCYNKAKEEYAPRSLELAGALLHCSRRLHLCDYPLCIHGHR